MRKELSYFVFLCLLLLLIVPVVYGQEGVPTASPTPAATSPAATQPAASAPSAPPKEMWIVNKEKTACIRVDRIMDAVAAGQPLPFETEPKCLESLDWSTWDSIKNFFKQGFDFGSDVVVDKETTIDGSVYIILEKQCKHVTNDVYAKTYSSYTSYKSLERCEASFHVFIIDNKACIKVTKDEYLQKYTKITSYPNLLACNSALKMQILGEDRKNAVEYEKAELAKKGDASSFVGKTWYNFRIWLVDAGDWGYDVLHLDYLKNGAAAIFGSRDITGGKAIGLWAVFSEASWLAIGGFILVTLFVWFFTAAFMVVSRKYGASKLTNGKIFFVCLIELVIALTIISYSYEKTDYTYWWTAGVAFGILIIYIILRSFEKVIIHSSPSRDIVSLSGSLSFFEKLWINIKKNIYGIIGILLYPFLMTFPVAIRIIQIITLEFLMPDSYFIRGFILVFWVAIMPDIISRLKRYQERRELYRKNLEEKTGKMILRALPRA